MKYNVILFAILLCCSLILGNYGPVSLDSHTVPGLVTRTLPAVVELRPGFARWLGAGVVISEDGWVMTAGHVVEDQDVMIVTMRDGMKYMSVLIIEDPNSDTAILKIDVEDTPYVRLYQGYPQLGAPVYAIGHPLGVLYSISLGVVSNSHINKPWFDSDLIVTDAEITGGNSGGPLFNMEGCLLGIVVAGSSYFTGVEANLVIPVARGRKLLDEYRKRRDTSANCNSVDLSAM